MDEENWDDYIEIDDDDNDSDYEPNTSAQSTSREREQGFVAFHYSLTDVKFVL